MALDALRRSPTLQGLPDDALTRLTVGAQEVELATGEVLMEEGEDPDAMYVLLDGELEAHKKVAEDDMSLGTVEEGELVGELGLLHGRPRAVGLRATRPSRLLRIPAESLDELLGHPATSRALLATATDRLESLEVLRGQHGRMAALGTVTAGLLHELNNPSAAVRRAVDHLGATIEAARDADRAISAHVPPSVLTRLEAVVAERGPDVDDAMARADAEEEWRTWLEGRGVDRPWEVAGSLAAGGIGVDDLAAALAEEGTESADATDAVARWVAARLRLERLLDEAGTGASRIAEIVGAVKSYSHHDEAPFQDVDVHEGLDAALTLLRHKIGPGVQVARAYAEDLPTIEGYPGDLNSVWTNLIDNAVDAVGDHGKITLRTEALPDQILVQVIDDGPGIPEDVAARVFDPFFTTKPIGQGTGLGLATSQAIVTRWHHGRITFESQPGRTAVSVTLPQQQERIAPAPAEAVPEGATGDGSDLVDKRTRSA